MEPEKLFKFTCPICGGHNLHYKDTIIETGEVDVIYKEEDEVKVEFGTVLDTYPASINNSITYCCGSCSKALPSINEMLEQGILSE